MPQNNTISYVWREFSVAQPVLLLLGGWAEPTAIVTRGAVSQRLLVGHRSSATAFSITYKVVKDCVPLADK